MQHPPPASSSALTYTSYLKVHELLSLQERKSSPPEHDEMLFIVIHQVYELWFKQIIHEMAFLQSALETNDAPRAAHTFKRILTILKTLVAQIDVLETMTPLSFASFRGRLESASGFQSVQFRQVEFILGNKNARMLEHHRHDPHSTAALRQAYQARTLYDSFLQFLAANGFSIPPAVLTRDVTAAIPQDEGVRSELLRAYRTHPTAAAMCERMVDLDEGLQEWRYRHVKMVERTIGSKIGTGGSAGADYLRSTLFRPHFPDLWTIRAEL